MNEYVVSLLSDLIRMKPVSDQVNNVNRVIDRLQSELAAAGLYCKVEDIDGRKCLYAATVEGKTPDYLLNAHVDVVPADDHLFEPRIKDGYMYARGTNDCLGACICMLEILKQLKGKASCGAIFSSDEEIGGATTAEMVKRGYGANKAVIVIDSYWPAISYAQKGIMIVKLTAESVAGGGHSSAPWAIENPIEILMEDYAKIRAKWENPTADNQWKKSISPTIINGGFVHNQIPSEATLTMNIRIVEAAEVQEVKDLIKECCRSKAEIHVDCLPVTTSVDHPEVIRLRQTLADALKMEIPLIRMNGATDARAFVELGKPIAILGIDGKGSHSTEEFARIDSITELADTLVKFIAG